MFWLGTEFLPHYETGWISVNVCVFMAVLVTLMIDCHFRRRIYFYMKNLCEYNCLYKCWICFYFRNISLILVQTSNWSVETTCKFWVVQKQCTQNLYYTYSSQITSNMNNFFSIILFLLFHKWLYIFTSKSIVTLEPFRCIKSCVTYDNGRLLKCKESKWNTQE